MNHKMVSFKNKITNKNKTLKYVIAKNQTSYQNQGNWTSPDDTKPKQQRPGS